MAGNGVKGFSGDGGPASDASLNVPQDVAVDAAGKLFVADWGNHRIRQVSPDGIIRTVAGNGSLGISGDGGPATNASLERPSGVAVDAAGNLFISVSERVRVVLGSPPRFQLLRADQEPLRLSAHSEGAPVSKSLLLSSSSIGLSLLGAIPLGACPRINISVYM